jgi:undecaprenyl-diphosphatase
VSLLAANSLRAIARGQFRDRNLRFSLWIILATIPIGIAGLLLAKLLKSFTNFTSMVTGGPYCYLD